MESFLFTNSDTHSHASRRLLPYEALPGPLQEVRVQCLAQGHTELGLEPPTHPSLDNPLYQLNRSHPTTQNQMYCLLFQRDLDPNKQSNELKEPRAQCSVADADLGSLALILRNGNWFPLVDLWVNSLWPGREIPQRYRCLSVCVSARAYLENIW